MEKDERRSIAVPEMVVDDLARCLLPIVQEFYDTAKRKEEFENCIEKNEEAIA